MVTKGILGTRIGFVNFTKGILGMRIGFANLTKGILGARIGFVNFTKGILGTGIGFVTLWMPILGRRIKTGGRDGGSCGNGLTRRRDSVGSGDAENPAPSSCCLDWRRIAAS